MLDKSIICNLKMNRPFVIEVEGIIAAGKTTLIEECLIPYLKEKGWRVTLIKEPVDEWTEILPLFYEDPKRWAYHFQTTAFHSRVRESQRMWREHASVTDVFITERGPLSDQLFMKTLHQSGQITDLELKHYYDWWKLWTEVMPFYPDMILYLSPSIDESMRRINERARPGEEKVTPGYQQTLMKVHDELFGHEFVQVTSTRSTPVLHIDSNKNYKKNKIIREEVVSSIVAKMVVIGSRT
jgi:deoxyadenosine/deoxycytidine kinase